MNVFNAKYGNIAHINIRSLLAGFEYFIDVVLKNSFDIVCMSETWLTNGLPSHIVDVPGYTLYREDRQDRRGEGVGIYVKDIFASNRYGV